MNTGQITDEDRSPFISHAEPVLSVIDVAGTVKYWHDTLGFPNTWTYGTPVNHGGVSWNGSGFIQFGINPGSPTSGQSVWISVRNLDRLYAMHQENKAQIVAPLENKPWGCMEYTVKDINGHYIHFSAPASDTGRISQSLPPAVVIHQRVPTVEEHNALVQSVGWSSPDDKPSDDKRKLLENCITGTVAEDTASGTMIGCGLLLGDNSGFYYIKDVVVHPDWQRKNVGTKMMKSIMEWLYANAPENATVGLFTGDHLAGFYRQFGFMRACGMYQQIIRTK